MADKSKMKCNSVRPSDRAGKKRMVKGCEGGKEKLIHFGAKGYGHNYSAAARKSFRARHKCDTAKSKLTARYWACKNLWAGQGRFYKKFSKKSKRKILVIFVKKRIMDGLEMKFGREINMRPDSRMGIAKLADMKRMQKRFNKVRMIAEGNEMAIANIDLFKK